MWPRSVAAFSTDCRSNRCRRWPNCRKRSWRDWPTSATPSMSKPDLREFLEARTASPVGFSGDGRHVYVSANLPGTAQLYRVPVEGGELEQLTSLKEPVGALPIPGGDRV